MTLMQGSHGGNETDRGEAVVLFVELGHDLVAELSHSVNTTETTRSRHPKD